MVANFIKLSTMVGENLEIYLCQIAADALKLSTTVGENFEIYLCQIHFFYKHGVAIEFSEKQA